MSNPALLLNLAASCFAWCGVTTASLPDSLDLELIRALPVQHDGRWMPLDTLARDAVRSVTGSAAFQGHDPLLLLLAWTFDSSTWTKEPLISIRNAELRRELQLSASQSVYAFSELVGHDRLRDLVEELSALERNHKPDPLQAKAADIHERLLVLQRIFSRKLIRPIPDPKELTGAWLPIGSPLPSDPQPVRAAHEYWERLRSAFLAHDPVRFAEAARQVAESLGALPAAYRPNERILATELRYNRLRPYHLASSIMAIAGLLSAAAMVWKRRWLDILSVTAILIGFGTLTYGLALRWQIAGRIPASNMFESLLFLAWGAGAFAVAAAMLFRERLVPVTAACMSAVALLLADRLPMDPFIRPIAPVLLDTVWMSIHVPVIMVSYAVLALAVLVAHVQLVTMAVAPTRIRLIERIDTLHYGYVQVGTLLLTAGIITGSMWAAASWGRYWGWDPKEVWSLVALFGYLTILHVRINRKPIPRWVHGVGAVMLAALFTLLLWKFTPISGGMALGFSAAGVAAVLLVATHGPFATAVKSILCFWLIIMTYVGVNYVLGAGLHSYGFGTGAVVRSMFLLGGGDLIIVIVCCMVFLLRSSKRSRERGFPPIMAAG